MRILFVAMSQSIHTVRWIRQLLGQGWDIHLYPSWGCEIHPEHADTTIHTPGPRPSGLDPTVRLKGREPRLLRVFRNRFAHRLISKLTPLSAGGRRLPPPLNLLRAHAHRALCHWSDPARRLAKVIQQVKPDLIHSLEIQHAGYLTLDAKKIYPGEFPPWIVTNWGNDTYFFGRLRKHINKIEEVFASCNYYDCESYRDIRAARDMGFKGRAWPVTPNTGGFHLDKMEGLRRPGPTSSRRWIVLKGYQSWAGRSLTALRAIELCADLLKERGYRVAIYLANPDVMQAAELLSHDTGLEIEIIPYCSNEQMLRWHGKARMSIGCSITDGVAISFLEALMMGSFPIQSYTATADEWVKDGETGFIIHPMDPEGIAKAIRRAATDDELVDRAAKINAQTARERLDHGKIQAEVIGLYERAYAESQGQVVNDWPEVDAANRCVLFNSGVTTMEAQAA